MEYAIGERIGDYELTGLLNAGGMALVFRARHVHLRRKRLALKILRPELAVQQEIIYRFKREARVISRLRHPNIPRVYGFIELPDRDPPVYCMMMELLSGCDLAGHIAAVGALDPAAAVTVGRQVADALSVLHGANILHRDVKPANIFLAPRADNKLHVKLLDFGLVKGTATQHATKLTGENRVAGTPEYMAPEQLLDEEVDQRIDLYGLGASLYEMLTGEPPYGRATDYESYAGFMINFARQDSPQPISELRPAELPPVPPALDAVVRRCLRRDPGGRFMHAAELSEALVNSLSEDGTCEYLAEEETTGVVAVVDPTTAARRASWVLLAAAAAVLTMAIAALIFAVY